MIPKAKKLPKIGKLQKEADKLMQEVGKLQYPVSIISGKKTEVIHHLVSKSVSAILRYDWENLIPLTNAEHCRLHQSGDPAIEMEIVEKRGGIGWFKELRLKGRKSIKVNRNYYQTVLEKLNNRKDRLL
jgi:hypothetical protein